MENGPQSSFTNFASIVGKTSPDSNRNTSLHENLFVKVFLHCWESRPPSSSSLFRWATTIIKLIIFVAYSACLVCWCCHNPPNSDMDYRISIVRTDVNACDCTRGCTIIHRTLTWTTGSLSGAQMLMQAIAHGGVRTPKESLRWKLTLEEKFLAAPGNRTCVSGMTVRCSNQLSYILSQTFSVWSLADKKSIFGGVITMKTLHSVLM